MELTPHDSSGEPEKSRWVRDVEEVLARAWPDQTTTTSMATHAERFVEWLCHLYGDVRSATLEAAPPDVAIGEARQVAERGALEFIGRVALQLGIDRPGLARTILGATHPETEQSVSTVAKQLGDSIADCFQQEPKEHE